MRRSRQLLAGAAGLAAVIGLAVTTPAWASPVSAHSQPQVQAAPDIDVDNVLAHLAQFQSFAEAGDGSRSAGSEGYAASADYVAQSLTDAGFEVQRQSCQSCTSPDDNIIADWPGGDDAATVMLGAHLDGVSAGPGINDNGSGSAALLEVALRFAESNPQLAKHVRFGWWADEEAGLNGSADYVRNGGAEGVEAYLNFDMVGSPNAGYFVDGLDNAYGQAFEEYLTGVDKAPEQMRECCSDDLSFQDAGVPTAFLSTGAGATKTQAQADKWGGTAGESYDECYHSSCDSNPDNINAEALNNTSDAIAFALWKAAVAEA